MSFFIFFRKAKKTRMKRLKTENARKKDKYRISLKRERNKKDIEKDIQTGD